MCVPQVHSTSDPEGFGAHKSKERFGALSKYRWGVQADDGSGGVGALVVRVEPAEAPMHVKGGVQSARSPFGPHPVHTAAPSIAQPVARPGLGAYAGLSGGLAVASGASLLAAASAHVYSSTDDEADPVRAWA